MKIIVMFILQVPISKLITILKIFLLTPSHRLQHKIQTWIKENHDCIDMAKKFLLLQSTVLLIILK